MSSVTAKSDFHTKLIELAEHLGFPLCNIGIVQPVAGEAIAWEDFRNAPSSYFELAVDKDDARRDPCLNLMKKSYMPFCYDREFYVRAGTEDLWEKQAPFGYKTGICSVLHLGVGRALFMGLDREEVLPKEPDTLIRLLADFQLATAFVQDTAMELHSHKPFPEIDTDRLSERQKEVLRWASAGKTAWETGRILSISESAVNKTLARAARILECNGKAHAIARAFSRGLL